MLPVGPATHLHVVLSLRVSGSIGRGRGKGEVHPTTGHEGPDGEYRYSCTHSLTSALDGGGWSKPRTGRYNPRKETRYPLYRRLGGPQGLSGQVWRIPPPPPGFSPRTIHPVVSRYTN
jgi:hypothetical protein